MKIIKQILTSKIGVLVMMIHWVICALAIYQRGGISERSHHFINEPVLFKLVFLLDLFWLALIGSSTGKQETAFTVGFLLAGLQWFLIGYFIGRIKEIKLK